MLAWPTLPSELQDLHFGGAAAAAAAAAGAVPSAALDSMQGLPTAPALNQPSSGGACGAGAGGGACGGGACGGGGLTCAAPLIGAPSIFAPPLGNGLGSGGLCGGGWGQVFGAPVPQPQPLGRPAAATAGQPPMAPPQLLGGLSHAFAAQPMAGQQLAQPWGASQTWGGPAGPLPGAVDGANWQPPAQAKHKGAASGLPAPPQGGYSLW